MDSWWSTGNEHLKRDRMRASAKMKKIAVKFFRIWEGDIEMLNFFLTDAYGRMGIPAIHAVQSFDMLRKTQVGATTFGGDS